MKSVLRKLFSPILNHLESGDDEFRYVKSHRTILIAVGGLFLVLSCISTVAAIFTAQIGALIPIFVFFAAGVTCVVVGICGNERAVATIWRSK